MTEWKLFDGDTPFVSTHEFHVGRPRAAHLEEDAHRDRLMRTAAAIVDLVAGTDLTVVDLGCGDGGLLQLLKTACPQNEAWGYDFHEPNAAGWAERGVNAQCIDVFSDGGWYAWRRADVVVMTEVLEHLATPHRILAQLPGQFIVASSPRWETDVSHCGEHAWAWDEAGYATMFREADWFPMRHEPMDWSQLMVARRY